MPFKGNWTQQAGLFIYRSPAWVYQASCTYCSSGFWRRNDATTTSFNENTTMLFSPKRNTYVLHLEKTYILTVMTCDCICNYLPFIAWKQVILKNQFARSKPLILCVSENKLDIDMGIPEENGISRAKSTHGNLGLVPMLEPQFSWSSYSTASHCLTTQPMIILTGMPKGTGSGQFRRKDRKDCDTTEMTLVSTDIFTPEVTRKSSWSQESPTTTHTLGGLGILKQAEVCNSESS